MYQTPTRADFQRNLFNILQQARGTAHADVQRITVEHAARGLESSGPVIGAIAARLDQLHAETTEITMQLIREFVRRTQLTPTELGSWARPQLENVAAELVACIPAPAAGLQQAAQQTRAKYAQAFAGRLTGALRDIEIGFIAGRDVAASGEQYVQRNAFRLLKAIEAATRGSARPVDLSELADLQMAEGEAQAAFQYLKGKGLIEAKFLLPYSARVSAAGHDAIQETENNPDRASRSFPAITYNYHMSIRNMTGSNVQQGTTGSVITAAQTITTEQLVDGVRNLVEQLDRALPTSDLPDAVQEQAREALTELRAAANLPVPDPAAYGMDCNRSSM
jgi:hypothetical protein